jgi:predicted DsbA family dithiol-disulfide isomerase
VHLAHQYAMESDLVTADMVEATEFPQLATRYDVRGVPRTIANERPVVDGAMPEPYFLEEILRSLGKEGP